MTSAAPADARDAIPRAWVSVRDPSCRAAIIDVLERTGWAVMIEPSGYHVVGALAGMISGDAGAARPAAVVVDAISVGCCGTTIARELHSLGFRIPVVLIAGDERHAPIAEARAYAYVTAPSIAPVVVKALARGLGRLGGRDPDAGASAST